MGPRQRKAARMSDIVLLDGGLGQELVRRSGDRPTPLWSTQVMLDLPGLVEEVHRDFLAAGATVLTTNTYAIHRDRLEGGPLAQAYEALLQSALAEARAARNDFPAARIAGSLGPLGASYRPDLAPPPEEAAQIYSENVGHIAPACDLLILETMASLSQAEGALRAASEGGRPVWLALTVSDTDGTRLRSGEPLSQAEDLVERHAPEAVLVNCSVPEVIGQALPVLASFGRPYGAYANGFERISEAFLADRPTVEALTGREDLSPERYADFAMGWAEQGATILGGCCEVGPGHIAELARRLKAAGHRIV